MNFIKIGRVYWIKPMPIPGMISKERPALALSKYDNGKIIFIQFGTTNSKIPSSVIATNLIRKSKYLLNTDLEISNLHIDVTKPEWNTSVLRPFLKKDINKAKYVDIEYSILYKIRNIYFARRKELRAIRIKKAKIEAIKGNTFESFKQLKLLKMSEPIKYKNMDVKKLVEKFKNF